MHSFRGWLGISHLQNPWALWEALWAAEGSKLAEECPVGKPSTLTIRVEATALSDGVPMSDVLPAAPPGEDSS